MRQSGVFGGLQLRKEQFFDSFFFITINFQEISDVISALRFLTVPDLKPQATT